MQQNGAITYLFSDRLGSNTYATDVSGNIKFSIGYNAWGEQRYSNGTVSTTFQYTDQRNDSAIGLYFYNARYYDPYLNRWIQPGSCTHSGLDLPAFSSAMLPFRCHKYTPSGALKSVWGRS